MTSAVRFRRAAWLMDLRVPSAEFPSRTVFHVFHAVGLVSGQSNLRPTGAFSACIYGQNRYLRAFPSDSSGFHAGGLLHRRPLDRST